MCGIAGYFGFEDIAGPVLSQMIEAIAHRGPDKRSSWHDSDAQIHLAHARLSIIDLEPTGDQPMHSKNGRYSIVYNGEIYNYKKLRTQLESEAAIEWVGTSDTEVLLACIERWGINSALNRVEGMFAIALWDSQQCTLQLIRDRFGEKPLYVQHSPDGFIFASELSAISQHPQASRDLEPMAVESLLRYGYVAAPLSIIKTIFKVAPGSSWSCSLDGEVEVRQYWHPSSVAKKGIENRLEISDEQAVAKLDMLLSDVVADQMLSDVPLGAFLSGGIDSSLITAQMQRISSSPINTFSIGFEVSEFNEAHYAADVARELGTNHTEFYVSERETLDVVPKLSTMYSEPFADSSQIPTHLVAKLARQNVTVALSGDAGDEIFCGYNRYQFARHYWGKMNSLPVSLRRMIGSVVSRIPADRLNVIADKTPVVRQWSRAGEKLHRNASLLAAASLAELYKGLCQIWKNPDDITTPQFQQTINESALPSFLNNQKTHDPKALSDEQWMMLQDQITYLPDDILTKVDRAAMAVSLETRTPFLNHRVAEFAWSLPDSLLMRNGEAKWLPKKLLRNYLPDNLIDRPKMGFAIPLHELLRGPLKAWASDCLSDVRIQDSGVFDVCGVHRLWEMHLSGKQNNAERLWTILMFQSWYSEAVASGILSPPKKSL